VTAVLQIEEYSSDFNRYYHTSGDTVEHMDLDYFAAQVRSLVATAALMAGPEVQDPTVTPEPSEPASTSEPTEPQPSVTPLPPPVTLHIPLAFSG